MGTNLLLASVAIVSGHMIYTGIESRNIVMADDSKQSSFLRSYDVRPVLTGCRAGLSTSLSAASGANGFLHIEPARDVQFTKTLETGLCPEGRFVDVLAILDIHIRSAVNSSGCAILSQTTSPGVLRFTYRCGDRTSGVVSAETDRKKISVKIDERWLVRRG